MITDATLREFFYSWPFNEPKPPGTAWGIYDEGADQPYIGIEIQFAVAGFESEDIEVSTDGRTLVVQGDNRHRDNIAMKFQCMFTREISLKETLDIENPEISLENGILSIRVMTAEREDKVKKLF